jgi:hypothetical protein
VHDRKPESLLAFAPASCRIVPFRRRDVSKVCRGGGVLLAFPLAFAASQKCRSDLSPKLRNAANRVFALRGYTSFEIAHPSFANSKTEGQFPEGLALCARLNG